jgi:malonyl-CoA decarboxylase
MMTNVTAAKPPSALSKLLASFTRQGRELFERYAPKGISGKDKVQAKSPLETAQALASALMSVRGEASGVAMARDLIGLYKALSRDEQRGFFTMLAEKFDPDPVALEAAWNAYRTEGRSRLPALTRAVEAPRQELFRRINLAPDGTATLVQMRADLLSHQAEAKGAFDALEADLGHLLQSWFNRGFLEMRRIDWESPARLLESVIRYEAVHDIRDWADLRRRLDPDDRRCFAFFHPAMPAEPLIFVEVGLTQGIPGSIQDILAPGRSMLPAKQADTAVFYSISNCQEGLKGISFGHFLIKQVAIDLQRDLPGLNCFVTLSPIPGFMKWLRGQGDAELSLLKGETWWPAEVPDATRTWLSGRAVDYFTAAKNERGRPLDPVARFHLGNGARLERLNWLGDVSANGLKQSAALMVNYRYDLARIEENHEAYAERGEMVMGEPFTDLARALGRRVN